MDTLNAFASYSLIYTFSYLRNSYLDDYYLDIFYNIYVHQNFYIEYLRNGTFNTFVP